MTWYGPLFFSRVTVCEVCQVVPRTAWLSRFWGLYLFSSFVVTLITLPPFLITMIATSNIHRFLSAS